MLSMRNVLVDGFVMHGLVRCVVRTVQGPRVHQATHPIGRRVPRGQGQSVFLQVMLQQRHRHQAARPRQVKIHPTASPLWLKLQQWMRSLMIWRRLQMRGQCLNPFRRCNDGWRTKGATKRIYILFEFTLAVSRPVAGSSSSSSSSSKRGVSLQQVSTATHSSSALVSMIPGDKMVSCSRRYCCTSSWNGCLYLPLALRQPQQQQQQR